MADFVTASAVKSAKRKLTTPMTMEQFQNLLTDVITNNPWGCVDYVSGGVTVKGVVRGSEYYSGKVVYEDALAKTVGQISVKAPSQAAFQTDIVTILADTTLRSAMAGNPSHDSSEDTLSCTLKCNHSNGEKYSVAFKQDGITVSSYETDAILTAIETWADAYAGNLLA